MYYCSLDNKSLTRTRDFYNYFYNVDLLLTKTRDKDENETFRIQLKLENGLNLDESQLTPCPSADNSMDPEALESLISNISLVGKINSVPNLPFMAVETSRIVTTSKFDHLSNNPFLLVLYFRKLFSNQSLSRGL